MRQAFYGALVIALLAGALTPRRETWRPSKIAAKDVSDASLSLLETSDVGCRWSRVDPVTSVHKSIADLPAACADLHIVASPDGASALAWTPATAFGDFPAAWAVGIDVELGTIHEIAFPRRTSSVGFDGSGAPSVLLVRRNESFWDRAIGRVFRSRPAIELSHKRWNGSRWEAYEEPHIQASWSEWHVTFDDDGNPVPMKDRHLLAELRAAGGGPLNWAAVSDLSVFVAIEYADPSNPYSWWPTAPLLLRSNDGWVVAEGSDSFEGVLDVDARGEWVVVNDLVDARLYDRRTGRMVFRSRGRAEFWLDVTR